MMLFHVSLGEEGSMAREDIQGLINRINAQASSRHSSAFSDRVYADEPIIRRGSQMANYLPERIKQMRAIPQIESFVITPPERHFYEQAKFMEDYEEDGPFYSTFSHYYPTYELMGNQDLRRYFSWRTQVRQGKVAPTSLSFFYLLLYELLCGIGVEDPLDGFHKIENLWQEYRIFDDKVDRYAKRWLRDYAAWHNLPVQLVAPYANLAFDQLVVTFKRGIESRSEPSHGADAPGDEALFDAANELSSYQPKMGRLYRDRPDTLCHVTCAALAQLASYYSKHRKDGLVESLYGSPLAQRYTMFAGAVFWSPSPHEDCVYELDEVNCYVCRNGSWHREEYLDRRGRNAKLGSILRTIDWRLRLAIGYEHQLTDVAAPKYLTKIIDKEIEARLAWEQQREARRVHIDLGQLDQIRAAASVTREALLVDEEREGWTAEEPMDTAEPAAAVEHAATTVPQTSSSSPTAEPPTPAQPATPKPPEPTPETNPQAPSAPYGLTTEELAFVRALLEGNQPAPSSTSADMLVDSINEKLFDLLGDTALEFSEDGPQVIEDYLQDVRGALLP